jgi:hypothetical protein
MAQLFKTDVPKLAPYFAGGRKVIKGNVSAETAEKYRIALENVGLVIKIEACENEQPETQSDPQPEQATAATTPQEPQQQAERDKNNTEGTDTAGITLAPVGADVIENPVIQQPQKIADISGITMAEVGADVIETPVARAVQEIPDISGITLAEVGSELLDHQ